MSDAGFQTLVVGPLGVVLVVCAASGGCRGVECPPGTKHLTVEDFWGLPRDVCMGAPVEKEGR